MKRWLKLGLLMISLALVVLIAAFVYVGSSMNRSDLIASLHIKKHNMYVRGETGNRVSDPLYIRAYANNNLIFQCRMADRVTFRYDDDTLTILSNCNLGYEYDRVQKDHFKGVRIVHRALE